MPDRTFAVSRLRPRRRLALTAAIAAVAAFVGALLAPAGPAAAARVVSCPAPQPGVVTCFATARPASAAAVTDPTPYTPSDLAAAYAIPESTTTATVAIVVAYDNPDVEANMDTYRAQYGLPACPAGSCFQVVNQTGAATPLPTDQEAGWTTESDTNVQLVSAVCPTCHILLVEADAPNDVFTAVTTATDLGAQVVSMPWGTPDWVGAPSYTNKYFVKRGVAYLAAAGDTGYRTFFPAASPNVVAVGATTLTRSTDPRGWTETVWNDHNGDATSSGCSDFGAKAPWQSPFIPDTLCKRRASVDVAAVGDPATGVSIYEGGWDVAGGTSASTPIIAAMYALAGTPNRYNYPSAYPYYHAQPDSSTVPFNDITAGDDLNVDQGCSPDALCTAGAGWDGPSGVGTPIGVSGFAAVAPGTLSISKPADQHSFVDDTIALPVPATSTDPLVTFRYSANNLPPGATMTPDGTITGHLASDAIGTWQPTVVAHVSSGQLIRTSFAWTVSLHSLAVASAPTIAGTVKRGSTVRVSTGSWYRDSRAQTLIHPNLRYQWLADGKAIRGATGSAWRIPTAVGWRGKFLQVRVSARLTDCTPDTVTTRRTGRIK